MGNRLLLLASSQSLRFLYLLHTALFIVCLARHAHSRVAALAAAGAPAPVDHFGFIDLVPRVIGGSQAGCHTLSAVDIHHLAARSANEVMVVVSHTVFVPSRRARRLDAPNEPVLNEHAQCVVHGLPRDRPDLAADHLCDLVSRAVRPVRYGPHDGQALGRYLEPLVAEQLLCIVRHGEL